MSARRPRRRAPAPPATSTPQRTPQRRPRGRFRTQLDSFGGPVVVGAIVATVAILVFIAIRAMPSGPSTDPLLGEAVVIGSATHISDPAQLQIPEGQPPAGGPHFVQPQPPGAYNEPLADGNAIHSLEHGMVWISYRPDLLAAGDLETLQKVQKAHSTDVMLSPRPGNSDAVTVVSWGRRASIASPVKADTLNDFIERNLNRSPEPGVR